MMEPLFFYSHTQVALILTLDMDVPPERETNTVIITLHWNSIFMAHGINRSKQIMPSSSSDSI